MIDEDIRLLESAKRMDQSALMSIFDQYSTALFRYAFRLCRDAMLADQVVGDVFAKLLEQFACGKGPESNIRSYLFEMTYHLIVDESRYSQRFTYIEEAIVPPSDGTKEFQSVENHVLADILFHVMKHELSEVQRHVLILRFMEGFSLLETAQVVGKSVNNVKMIQNRAINCLRRVLERMETGTTSSKRAMIIPYPVKGTHSSLPKAI